MLEPTKLTFDGKDYDCALLSFFSNGIPMQFLFAETSLLKAIDPDENSESFKSSEAEKIWLDVEYFTDAVLYWENEADFINRLLEDNSDYEELFGKEIVRRCSVCGKVLQEGWMDNESDWHACSEECVNAYYRQNHPQNPLGARKKDYEADRCFYTEWETPFYD